MAPTWCVGAKFTYRKLGRVIEDFLILARATTSSPTRARASAREMTFYDYVDGAGAEGEAQEHSVRAHGAQALRRQLAVPRELRVVSKLEGNYDGTFQASTGQLDPNINSAFDYADFLVNADGRLTQRPQRTS